MTCRVSIPPDFSRWRERARDLLEEGVSPDDVVWAEAFQESGNLYGAPQTRSSRVKELDPIPVPKSFLSFAAAVACHSDPNRWEILYRLLWRVAKEGEKHLLLVSTDFEVRKATELARAVQGDMQKMRSKLRFRKVGERTSGREPFVSWYEPAFRIVRRNALYFQRRNPDMDWSLLTPEECAHWNGKELFFSGGISWEQAPSGEELEEIWRKSYEGLFPENEVPSMR